MRTGRVLTPEIREKIEQMAVAMKKPTAGKIANKLGLKTGTVYWFMITRGLARRKQLQFRMKPYTRNGITINPYSPEHDALILELRIAGRTCEAIAGELTTRFGIPRNAHSVHNRLVMLESIDDEPDGRTTRQKSNSAAH